MSVTGRDNATIEGRGQFREIPEEGRPELLMAGRQGRMGEATLVLGVLPWAVDGGGGTLP